MIPFLMERGGKETSRLPEGAVIIYPSVERLRFGVFSLEKMINPQACCCFAEAFGDESA